MYNLLRRIIFFYMYQINEWRILSNYVHTSTQLNLYTYLSFLSFQFNKMAPHRTNNYKNGLGNVASLNKEELLEK